MLLIVSNITITVCLERSRRWCSSETMKQATEKAPDSEQLAGTPDQLTHMIIQDAKPQKQKACIKV